MLCNLGYFMAQSMSAQETRATSEAELSGIRWLVASSPGSRIARDSLVLGHVSLRPELPLLNLLAARESHELAMVRTLTPLRRSSGHLLEALERAR